VDRHRRAGGVHDRGDLANRQIGAIVEEDGGALRGRELPERRQDVRRSLGVGDGTILRSGIRAHPLQILRRDPERHAVQVRHGIADRIAPHDRACERLRDGIVGDLTSAPRVGVDGPPDPRSRLAPDRVEVMPGVHSFTLTEPRGLLKVNPDSRIGARSLTRMHIRRVGSTMMVTNSSARKKAGLGSLGMTALGFSRTTGSRPRPIDQAA
jgi:hypothetical protein